LWQVVPFVESNGTFCRAVSVRPLGNRTMVHVNPGSHAAVLGSDEHPTKVVMPVAVTDEGPMVS
jgi:hypothetical protein